MAEAWTKGSVVIAGGSGFLGRNLAAHLADRGCDVVILSRNASREPGPWRHVLWDARTIGAWAQEIESAHAVVVLAGRSVDCRKTPAECDEILRSRIESTRVIGEAVQRAAVPPRVWVQMSTAHIYGDPPTLVCDETASTGYGLAPVVGERWERTCREGCPEHVRCVVLRTSFVLGRGGGALPRLAMLAKWGLGGTIGHGGQGISWIHEHDMNRLFEHAMTDDSMQGVYNATAPNPIANREFMRELREAIGQPIGLPAAAFMVRIAAPLFLRSDPDLALFGRYCISKRLEDEGFKFGYADIRSALQDLFD